LLITKNFSCFYSTQSPQNETNAKIAKKQMTENEISYEVIGAAIEIHKSIGPGLLESAYENALAYDLKDNIHRVVNNL